MNGEQKAAAAATTSTIIMAKTSSATANERTNDEDNKNQRNETKTVENISIIFNTTDYEKCDIKRLITIQIHSQIQAHTYTHR